MAEFKHSKGPYASNKYGVEPEVRSESTGLHIAKTYNSINNYDRCGRSDEVVRVATCERIAACVNACDALGFSDELLKRGSLRDMLAIFVSLVEDPGSESTRSLALGFLAGIQSEIVE